MFHERSVATGELLAQCMADTRNEIQSRLRPLGDLVDSVGTVAIETNEGVESIRTQARESKEGVRDQIRVLQSGFRRLAPSTRPIHESVVPVQPAEIIGPSVPTPETRTIQGPTVPVNISALVPHFERQIEAVNALRAAAPFEGVREALITPLVQARQHVQVLVGDTQADLEVLYESVASFLQRPAQRAPAGVPLPQRGRRPPFSPDTDPYSTHDALGGALGALARIHDILTPDRINRVFADHARGVTGEIRGLHTAEIVRRYWEVRNLMEARDVLQEFRQSGRGQG